MKYAIVLESKTTKHKVITGFTNNMFPLVDTGDTILYPVELKEAGNLWIPLEIQGVTYQYFSI